MASKSKKRRRVLGASCILAALIIAGSSFAWFTSKDEVTNRLTASADYGVSIAENFQPPENWIPGQSINKDVSVVNTGNVDAFARVWLTGEMKVLNTTSLTDTNNDKYGSSGFSLPGTAVTNENKFTALNLNRYKVVSDERFYYKELSVAQTTNPQNNGESNWTDGYQYDGVRGTGLASTPNSSAYSEVQSIQAGGYLVSAPADAEYEYVTNQETELKIYVTKASDSSITEQTVTVPAGTLVKVTAANNKSSGTLADTGDSSVTLATDNDKAVRGTSNVNTVYVKAASTFKPTFVDAETFAPVTKGTYIFARNIDQKQDNGGAGEQVIVNKDHLDDYEFTGYYFDNTADNKGKDGTNGWAGVGTYWALKNADANGTNRSEYTLPKNYAIKIAGTASDDKLDSGYGTGTGAYNDKVLTLDFNNSGELAGVTPTADLQLYSANYKQIENEGLTWVYDGTNKILSAVYQGGSVLDSATDTTAEKQSVKSRDDIVVDIQLANVGAAAQEWAELNDSSVTTQQFYYANAAAASPTNLNSNRKWTFYYNDDVESGDTTAKLVDNVTLRSTTKKEAFIAFDFDLNVNMESVQVTIDEAGKEKTTPVNTWVATTGNTGAQPDHTKDSGNEAKTYTDTTEISVVGWEPIGTT